MISTRAISTYSEIGIKIDSGELEYALLLIEKKLNSTLPVTEQCRLHLLQAWIYYLYDFKPIALSYINLVLKHRDTIDSYLVIESYLVRGLLHLRQGKYVRCYESAQKCLMIDSNCEDAKKLLEILKLKTNID